jgi:ankyrin repeat protein/Zn-dependent protease with chaperone function
MDSYLTQITNYLLTQSWQIAVLVAVVAAVTLALKNRSAHVRYLLWLIVLARCIVPPLFTIPLAVLPETEVSEVLTRSEDLIPLALEGRETPAAEAPVSLASLAVSEPTPTAAETTPRLSVRQWLGLGWIIGATLFVLVAATKAMRTEFWLRRERKPLPAGLQGEIEDLFSSLGVKISPKLWLVEGIGQPFVWGLLRGDIYLPANFVGANNAEHRRGVLGHELSHVLRFDAAVNLLQIMAQAAFWFHPFVWWANKRIRAEREKCCDEMTIARLGAKAKDYSKAIVNILISEHESTRPVPSLAVAGPVKNIEERIKTMLRPGKKFYKRPSLIAATTILLAAFLTVPTALVLTARAQTETSKPQGQARPPLHEATVAWDIEKIKSLLSQGVDVNARDNLGRTALHCACAKFDTPSDEIARLLITRGADVNARDNDGNTPLHVAAGEWDISKDLLDLLLAKGADINARNDDGQTPLHLASPANLDVPAAERERRNRVVAANVLVSHGAQINAKDKNGCTPLYVASGNGRRDVVELLLARGATINEKTNDGLTALHRAAMLGRTETATALMQQLGRENPAMAAKDRQGCTPLHYAAKAGANDIVERLVSNDANVNPKNVRGETPAHLAVLHNHQDTVRLLLSKGVEVSSIYLAAYVGDLAKVKSCIAKGVRAEAQDGSGLTPLHAAAGAGQRAIAEFLISQGASVNASAVPEGLGTPLHYAADGGSKEMTELLIKQGATVDARNKEGETPLHIAAQKGYSDLTQLLIANKADLNAKTKNGQTPLFCAAQLGHKDVMKLLIDKGADVSPIDELLYWMCEYGHRDLAEILIQKGANVNSEAWGDAPSFVAVFYHRPDVLKLLLDHGANPNARNEWGWTLLHHTVDPVSRSLDMTRMLLDKGANPNAKIPQDGSSPFQWAAYYGLKETVELFLAKGADVNAEHVKGHTALWEAKEYGHDEVVVELLRQHGAKE